MLYLWLKLHYMVLEKKFMKGMFTNTTYCTINLVKHTYK